MGRKARPFIERLMENVTFTESGCWVYAAHLTSGSGYRTISVGKKPNGQPLNKRAHRAAYEELVRPIPEGLTLDHLCRVKACVNPDHLEAVSIQENIRRATLYVTHCPHGHLYDDENTRINPVGARVCVTCVRQRGREYRRKKRGPNNRGPASERTHCPQGHEYTPENTYINPGNKARNCRECMRERDRARYSAKYEAQKKARQPQ